MQPSMGANHDEDLPLSNNDIDILYEIVRQAQSLPENSSRALFTAYNTVLAERDLNPEHDTILSRFLFRMQQNAAKRVDESLVERFQRVLADMDIQVEVNSDGEGIEVTTDLGYLTRNGQPSSHHVLGSRRGSFDSFFDGTADKIAGTDAAQDMPLRSRRGSRGATSELGGQRETTRRSRSHTDVRSQLFGQLPVRNRVNGNADRRTVSEHVGPPQRRRGSVSSRGSLQIRRNGHARANQAGDYDDDESEQTDQTDDFKHSDVRIPGINAPIPDANHGLAQQYMVPEPYRPSDTQMIDDAEAFEYQRIHAVARACFRNWRNRTRERAEEEGQMAALAFSFDRRILLKQSLDSWFAALQAKRQSLETDRFFGRLETRAEKARNLFLLTKAFTHWAKSAEDEVQRTSVARRHILRTKHFNAWRDITAVNQLKIQHFVLGKFLDKWRSRTATVRDNSDLAVSVYEQNLVSGLYRGWFWKFCNNRAPVFYTSRLKKNTFKKWMEISRLLKERENWATDSRDHEILRKTLVRWKQKVGTIRLQEDQAQQFRQTALASSALYIIQKQAKFVPLLAQFKAQVDNRVLRATFQSWHRNFQLSRQSQHVNRMRILRNAWTAWNDRLRINALADRINDRVIIENLYKWTLASRVSLFHRVHDRKLLVSAFTSWMNRTQERRNTLEAAERRFVEFKRAQTLRFCLRKIENATVAIKSQEFLALSVYEPKLRQRMFDNLIEKHAHFQQLDQWARDARFYVLTTHALKRWNEATLHARRNRRRETYTQVRRMVKMNLVRRAFGAWRGKAAQLAIRERQAEELVENRILRTSTALLTQWRDRTSTLRDREAQAAQRLASKLISTYLSTWSNHLQELQTWETQALALRQESTELTASSCFKKLGWRLFNIQRQEENALALHQRNFEKHLRAMIRFWFEQTTERIAQNPISPTPSSRFRGGQSYRDDDEDDDGNGHGAGGGEEDIGTPGSAEMDEAGDETRRLEAWTAFDEGGLGLSNLDLSLSLSPQRRPFQPTRPQTYPQPQSSIRPAPIPEDFELDDQAAFWASTPMLIPKPGYLKTPSKRSVARSKRPELPPSPEKRSVVPALKGSMSAPPVPHAGTAVGAGEVTSFERRLREGGFSSSIRKRGGGRRRGKGRVEFGDVSEFG